MGHKNNKYQESKMEQYIYDKLISGWSNVKITKDLIDNHGYKKDNCVRLIAKVIRGFIPHEEETIERLKEKYISMHLDLYEKSLEKKDTKTANEILKAIEKLQGLDIQKVEIKDTTFEVKF